MRVELPEKIRRIWHGSLADLARQLGISPSSFQRNIEGSEPGFARGVRLAKILGVPADWLADDSAEWPPPASQDEKILSTVRAAMATATDLPAEERELLRSYRSLDKKHQDRALGLIIGLAAYGNEADAQVLAEALEAVPPPGGQRGGKRKTAS